MVRRKLVFQYCSESARTHACDMTKQFAMRYLLLLVLTSCVFGSHFRGGVIMVRPKPDGESNEVNFFYLL